jgi:hypothetical protein
MAPARHRRACHFAEPISTNLRNILHQRPVFALFTMATMVVDGPAFHPRRIRAQSAT